MAERTTVAERAFEKLKRQARSAVGYAIKTGRLVVGPCVHADATCRGGIEGHHHSYERRYWLDVEWVCVSHHRRAHPPSASNRRRSNPRYRNGATGKPAARIELATARLRIECSTSELSRQTRAVQKPQPNRNAQPTRDVQATGQGVQAYER